MNFRNDPPHSPKSHMISPILGGGDMQRLLGDPSAIFFFFFFFFFFGGSGGLFFFFFFFGDGEQSVSAK